MIAIRNNILALYASDQLKTNARKKTKSMERLSSGYRINRSADDAAGLAISEKMRRQIRGLMQGTANAEDGISYVQVSDGAMGETHDILQRMNELTIQSLNDTLSESDREYLNSEFKQLRTEIDRINTTTDFNDQRVFEDHENSYWSITGNKRWDPSQAHTVLPAPSNEMYIHLPANYNPNTYTLSVPVGTYTTLELADEIDTVIENLTPSNPGFVFEYTEEGYCKLTFEGGSMINSVDGPMSYLFFDSAQGSSSSDILGTSKFPLEIKGGHNDTLGFYVEGRETPVVMTIAPGSYTRPEMITRINGQLPDDLKSVGVRAEEYGESSIKITSGKNVTITGLKGNMFKWENFRLEDVYDSAFYDNVGYGKSGGTQAHIEGEAHYYGYKPNKTDKIHLTAGNNVLHFKIDGASDYTEITFPEKTGGYTIDDIASEMNAQLNGKGAVASTGTDGLHDGNRLIITSLSKGSGSTLEFDRTPGSVFEATYNALFCDTRYLPPNSDTTDSKASITGNPYFDSSITLDSDFLEFKVTDGSGNAQTYKITGISGTYTSLSKLAENLNAAGITPPGMNGKITFENRLEHLVANNNNMVENTQASESAIRDADMAREAVQNSLHNIMMQTSQAMLSQANQMPDMVQKLLQA